MRERPEFTMAEALEIQELHLAQWMKVLKPEIWRELRDAVKASNPGVTDPYKVTRGSDLDSWMANYMLGNDYRPF